jgi:N-acetylglucosamine-6-sulfatase
VLSRRSFLAVSLAGGAAAMGLGIARFRADDTNAATGPLAGRVRDGDDDRLNVIVVVLDDTHPSMWEEMAWLRSRADAPATGWVRFDDSVVDCPICGPSRATLLSGESAVRHGMATNDLADVQAFHDEREGELIGPVLQAAGYHTAFAGKYLNEYPWAYGARAAGSDPDGRDETWIPPGWDDWFVLVRNVESLPEPDQLTTFTDYWVNDNGTLVRFGDDDGWGDDAVGANEDARAHRHGDSDYLTDRLSLRTRELLGGDLAEPFALFVGHLAPHPDSRSANAVGAPQPAARHRQASLRGESVADGPAFGADVSTKPAWVQAVSVDDATFEAERRAPTVAAQLEMSRAVQAIDEYLYDLDVALTETGLADRTVVIVYTDNGLCLGEFRADGKVRPWEPSIRTDLWVRHPAVGASRSESALASHVDVPATVLELAGAKPILPVDGRSLLAMVVAGAPSAAHRQAVVVTMPEPEAKNCPPYELVRAADGTKLIEYGEWTKDGETFPPAIELYDRAVDPHELTNLAGDPASAAIIASLRAQRDAALGR